MERDLSGTPHTHSITGQKLLQYIHGKQVKKRRGQQQQDFWRDLEQDMEIQYHSSVAEQIAKWFYPHHDDIAEEQIKQYLVKLEKMNGIVET